MYNGSLWNLIPGWVEHIDINEVEFYLRARNLSAKLGCLPDCAIICVEQRIYNHYELTIFHPQKHTTAAQAVLLFATDQISEDSKMYTATNAKDMLNKQYIKCAEKI